MNSVSNWLSEYQTNGVTLGLPELLAYRKQTHLLNLAPTRDVAGALSGAERSKIKGRGMEFDEARHYQPGDDIRSIDWRVTARTGRTHTKVFREERDRPVFVFVDFTDSMQFGTQYLYKSVQAGHLAALITWNAIARGDKIGGLVFNNYQDIEQKPKAQAKSAFTLLQHMVDLQAPSHIQKPAKGPRNNHSNMAFDDAIKRLHFLAKPGALIYLISDFSTLKPAAMTMIGNINRHCEIKAMLINDPMEIALPTSDVHQQLTVTNGSSRQTVELGEKRTYHTYAQQQSAHFSAIKSQFAQHAIDCRSISSAQPLQEQFTQGEMGVLL